MGVLTVALCVLSLSVSGQVLLNELSVNPGGTDNPCEYFELKGTPGTIVENIHFVSLEGDTNKGQATAVVTFGVPGPAIGSNGLLVVISATPCGSRTYPAGTTVLQTTLFDAAGGALQNGSNSFLLIASVTPITATTDYDTNDDGVLELPQGATIIDGVSWTDGGAGDVIYGTVLTASGGTIGAATRFPNNGVANMAAAWYAGAMVGTNDATTYSATIRTANFPANGALTPGAPNVGTPPLDSPVDINGDGRTDYVMVRPAGGAGSQLTWWNAINGGNPTSNRDWGVSGDEILCADFDGDGLDDPAVFRASNSTFYIIQSSSLTMRIDQFGQAGDNPRVVGDYDGDGRDDIAVYRPGAQGIWFYKSVSDTIFKAVNWGETSDVPLAGDFNGDGKNDFLIRRQEGGSSRFYAKFSDGTIDSKIFGLPTDIIVPGDYDGDGKTDLAVVRTNAGGFYEWVYESSETGAIVTDTWGVAASGDVIVQGDYNGDGKTDYAVWRPGAQGIFFVMTPVTRNIFTKNWGQTGDVPAARSNQF